MRFLRAILTGMIIFISLLWIPCMAETLVSMSYPVSEKFTTVAPPEGMKSYIQTADGKEIPAVLTNSIDLETYAVTPWNESLKVSSQNGTTSPVQKFCSLGKIRNHSIPETDWIGGYELWRGKGFVYAARDSEGEVVGLATFHNEEITAPSGESYEFTILRGECGEFLYWENRGEITQGRGNLPVATADGLFTGFISWDAAEKTVSDWSEKSKRVNEFTPWNGPGENHSDSIRGADILPGRENYDSKVETSFVREFGYDVFGKVRPWAHFMTQGNNIQIHRAQKLKVTFTGTHSQNFYIFRADRPDEFGTIEWFSGTQGYSDRVAFIPVKGGAWYGFCAQSPFAQKVIVEWDSSR